MKNLLFAALLSLLGSPLLYAQQDTTFTTVKEEMGTIEPQHYQTQYDQAFGTRIPAKWMVKWDASNIIREERELTTSIPNSIGFNIGVERKISEGVSSGGSYSFYKQSSSRILPISDWITTNSLTADVRWYYNMAKRIKEGRSANNFSGNYLGFQSGLTRQKIWEEPTWSTSFSARYGMQRRLLQHGFIDLSYRMSVFYQPKPYNSPFNNSWAFSTGPQFSIGLARFSPKNQDVSPNGACDVLHCFDENKRMLKVDLFNVLQNVSYSKQFSSLGAAPSIALEQKLGKLPFSVEVGARGAWIYNHFRTSPYAHYYKIFGGSIHGELRWYYNLQKRILTGKSGNNLSGPFIAITEEQGWSKHYLEHQTSTIIGTQTSTSIFTRTTNTLKAAWGVQHRMFDHSFIQFKAGVLRSSTRVLTANHPVDPSNQKYKSWSYFTEVKVGLAF